MSLEDVIGIEIDCTISAGRNLVAKDGSGFLKLGAKTTSDPYVVIQFGKEVYGKTEVCAKTLNPKWDATFKIHIDGKKFKLDEPIVFALYDKDRMSKDDPMGEVRIPLRALTQPTGLNDKWHPVQNCTGCNDAKGDLHVLCSVALRRALSLQKEQTVTLPRAGTVAIGLGWDMLRGDKAIDLDASCVAIDFRGQVMKEECVYFAQLVSRSGAIRHTGDEREGDEDLGQGDDEIILIDLGRLPQSVCALYFIATVATDGKTFLDVKSARIRLVDWKSGSEQARYRPADAGAHTALFFARIARKGLAEPWGLQAIGDFDHTARDWGTLLPEIQMYSRDLVPGLKADVSARVAVMRKGGLIRLSDYCPRGQVPPTLVMGLAWDVTDGINIDLDASAILLDANLKQLDLVFFGKLSSSDGALQHGGDEREGDEKGDDEKIFLKLGQVHPAVAYIGFVINSYSGQELDDVKDASCHLYDSATYRDIARFEMTNMAFLDKHTALLVGILLKEPATGEWAFEIAAEAAQGRTVHDNVDEMQAFLSRRPSRTIAPPRPPPGAGAGMLAALGSSAPTPPTAPYVPMGMPVPALAVPAVASTTTTTTCTTTTTVAQQPVLVQAVPLG